MHPYGALLDCNTMHPGRMRGDGGVMGLLTLGPDGPGEGPTGWTFRNRSTWWALPGSRPRSKSASTSGPRCLGL